jgi:hypothetical protein
MAQGYKRFRCHDCGWQFNERSDGVLNRTSFPSDIISFLFLPSALSADPPGFERKVLFRRFIVSHENPGRVG